MIVRRLIPVFAVLLAVAPRLSAQEQTFLFSTNPNEVVAIGDLKDIEPNISVRPNTARELNLFVRNGAQDPHDMRVQLLDGKGKIVAAADIKKAAKNSYTRVKFAKPAPPPAPAAVVPPAPPAAPMPMGPPLPPGVELGTIDAKKLVTFDFRLRLIDDTAIDTAWEKVKATPEGKDTPRETVAANLDSMNKWTQSVVVSVLDPKNYITLVGQIKYKNTGSETLLELTVKSDAKFAGPPCLVEMVFPPQPNLDVAAMGAGVYRKSITEAGQPVKLYASGLPLRNRDLNENETVYLNIDGVPRVYTFRPNLRLPRRDLTDIVPPVDPDVRLIEDGKKEPPVAFVSLPKDRFPLRVEVDNSTSPVKLELTQLNGELVTETTRPSGRHERVWIDPTGEGGAVHVEARVTDWIVPLDTRDMRGRFTLTATLTNATKTVGGEERPVTFTRTVVLDDTPPPVEKIDIGGFRDKQYRGRPMTVNVIASDPESDIVKVGVFFGIPAPDGKLPEPPVLVAAVPPAIKGAPWVAQLPIAADKKGGKEELTVVVTNAVGLTTAKTITIQLIDPPLGSAIKGTVVLGELSKKGIEGVTVILKDADGKDKDSTKTGSKGEYVFKDVLPGSYKVLATKADSAFGTKGEIAVRVRVGEDTEKADIALTRKP